MEESATATVGLVVGTVLAALTLVVVLVGVFQLGLAAGAVLALFGALALGSGLAFVSSLVDDGNASDVSRVDPTVDADAGVGAGVDPADTRPATDDALAVLRRRYAAGELSEAQFEGRVERLLADETEGDDARATLELRFARGELTDDQFKRKLARLDGTSSVEAAEELFDRDPEPER